MPYQSFSDSSLETVTVLDDRLDILRFAEFARRRWSVLVISCATAIALSAIISLLLPRQYTATASLIIEPPAGNDPRGATAISPVYLESLKTYERFASSDSLFATALRNLRLREAYSSVPMESLKKRVLRVNKPRDTKILEISATLPNPKNAQALARYLARETVELSRSLDKRTERVLTEQAREQLRAAAARVEDAEKARDAFFATDPIGTLEIEMTNATEQKLRLQMALTEARIDLDDYEARARAQSTTNQDPRDAATMREQLAASKARIARLEKEDHALAQTLLLKGALLEKRKQRRETLDNERQRAKAQYELANTKYSDTLTSAAFRSERLEIVDPGTVPERPSFPNLPLNIVVAFFAALFGSVLYLAFLFSLRHLRQAAQG